MVCSNGGYAQSFSAARYVVYQNECKKNCLKKKEIQYVHSLNEKSDHVPFEPKPQNYCLSCKEAFPDEYYDQNHEVNNKDDLFIYASSFKPRLSN